MIRWLTGDCRETLAALEPESVQMVATSPPYYGLRSYGTPDLVWGGDEHTHEWGAEIRSPWANAVPGPSANHPKNGAASHWTPKVSGAFCPCGAWRGSLGLEPDPSMYLANLVEVFRAVRRVLRPDATCWINLGDSYSGSGNGSNDHRENGSSLSKNDLKYQGQRPGPTRLPAKNLMMMPARVAMALQQDGWVLRSMMPWVKRSSMPESVRDRPSTAVEYIFLLSKGPRYYFDADAVRVAASAQSHGSPNINPGSKAGANGFTTNGHGATSLGKWTSEDKAGGRSLRNSDFFFTTWQGLLLDEQDEPLSFIVNPAGYSGAHFATWPTRLVEPMVKAGTSERGQCPEPGCGAPWVRTVERTERADADRQRGRGQTMGVRPGWENGQYDNHGVTIARYESTTTGWRPSCTHLDEPVPQTVLDPFAGSGTTLLVADRLGRNAIGCELSGSYSEMGTDRLMADGPLFMDLESA